MDSLCSTLCLSVAHEIDSHHESSRRTVSRGISLSSRRKNVITDHNPHSHLSATLGEEVDLGKEAGMEKSCF